MRKATNPVGKERCVTSQWRRRLIWWRLWTCFVVSTFDTKLFIHVIIGIDHGRSGVRQQHSRDLLFSGSLSRTKYYFRTLMPKLPPSHDQSLKYTPNMPSKCTTPTAPINSLAPGRYGSKFIFQTLLANWHLEHFFWNWGEVNVTRPHWWKVNICLGNGLMPSGNNPLPEPVLTRPVSPYGVARPQWVKISHSCKKRLWFKTTVKIQSITDFSTE